MFTESLSAFFNTGDFAVEARLASGAVVNVIFDAAFLANLGVAGTNPQALAIAAEVPASAIGAAITIEGTAYTVRNRRVIDDGSVVVLELTTG